MYSSETRFGSREPSLFERAKTRAGDACQRTGDVVRDNPASSVLGMFALGFGLGLAATLILMPSRRQPTWSDRHLPGWASRGRLAQAVDRLVPEAVSRYLARH